MDLPTNYLIEDGYFYYDDKQNPKRMLGRLPKEEIQGVGNCHGYSLQGKVEKIIQCKHPEDFIKTWETCEKKEEEIAVYVTYSGEVCHSSRKKDTTDGLLDDHIHKLYISGNEEGEKGFCYLCEPEEYAQRNHIQVRTFFLLPQQIKNFNVWKARESQQEAYYNSLETIFEYLKESLTEYQTKAAQSTNLGSTDLKKIIYIRELLEKMIQEYNKAYDIPLQDDNRVMKIYQKSKDLTNALERDWYDYLSEEEQSEILLTIKAKSEYYYEGINVLLSRKRAKINEVSGEASESQT